MKKQVNDNLPAEELEIILGFKPGKEQILDIITRARATGKPVGEVARDCSLPPLFFDFDNTGYIDTPEGRLKIEEYQKRHPWLKIIVIHSRN